MPSIYKGNLKAYESSEENMIRSVSVYYCGGIAGKKKYRKIYRNSCYKTKGRVHLSDKLMPFIKSVNVGNIYSVYDTLCDEDDKVCGCYRSLKELLLRLAEFYLSGKSGYTRRYSTY
ncbi:Hypothetical predicted protein [Paramuricea clavata]|uniref:Uncharacterized protein n=1 Tax=Paramuricea clavata TaxID=317549 RepID=A0A7D9I8J0_PARCT|nr:Hypothetical predicted protein [Paramuricea clavata]